MMRKKFIWNLQRWSGFLAMLFFATTFLTLFDGMRTGFFGAADIRLIPGERYAISGPMPPRTEQVQDFIIDGAPQDGSLRLEPEGIFTGYWLGGGMWRGQIAVDSALAGIYTITVHDRFGEKQNPALVFTVTIFADSADRQAHSQSIVYRWTGIEAYWFSAAFAGIGLILGGSTYLLGRKWSSLLAQHGCGEVFRLKTVQGQFEVGVHIRPTDTVGVGSMFHFTHPQRGDLGHGQVIACTEEELTVSVSTNMPIHVGDVACPV